MIDISKQTVKINCPECNRQITVALKQVADEAVIRCSCCKEIQLRDNNGSAKKAIRDINGAFRDLDNTIKKIGK
ncbi:MAG: hypothetical protein JNK50_04500 [Bacteroidia bacterium]|nr:hypothetical protein [Bacteroidia bacterium]